MRSLTSLFFSISLACSAVVVSCRPSVHAHSASLPTAPFASYHTFSFDAAEGAPGGYTTSPSSADIQNKMKPLIASALQNKGYSLSTTKGDFVVRYGSGRRNAKADHVRDSYNLSLEEDEPTDFVEGALVIDAFDGSNDGQIWHGSARTEINPDKVDDSLLAKSVDDVIAKFPAAVAVASPASSQ
jgi:Domain of unknown function (DUF4136)